MVAHADCRGEGESDPMSQLIPLKGEVEAVERCQHQKDSPRVAPPFLGKVDVKLRYGQQERPDKKVYALTSEGRRELQAWLETPTALNLDARNETFVKLMLARRLAQSEPLEVLKIEKRACLARLHEVTQARARAREEGESLQAILLLDLAVLRLEAFMKWLEGCDEALRQERQS